MLGYICSIFIFVLITLIKKSKTSVPYFKEKNPNQFFIMSNATIGGNFTGCEATGTPTPPINASQTACAFPVGLNSTLTNAALQCCGQPSNLTTYSDGCWQFCLLADPDGYQSGTVGRCITNALNNARVNGMRIGVACFQDNDKSAASSTISPPAGAFKVAFASFMLIGWALPWLY